MKINLTIPTIGDVNKYIGMPVLDKMAIYKFNEDNTIYKQKSKPIGIITKILETNEKDTLIEAEILDNFISMGYEINVANGNKQLSSISFEVK